MSILLRRCCAPQGDKICSVVLEKGKTQGRRPPRPGDNCPSAGAYGMRPYGVMGVYLIIYIERKNTPPGSVGLRAGWLGGLFTSDQTHKAGQTKGERRDIGDCQQGSNQCHKVGDQLGGDLLDGDMADTAADEQN